MSEAFRQSLSVSIPRTSTSAEGDGSKFTIFSVQVVTPYSVYEVPRRYRQFDALNIELAQLSAKSGIRLPLFPKKHLLGTLQSAFVEERRNSLQEYLVGVCEIENALKFEPLVRFLELTLPLKMSTMAEDISTAFTEIRTNSAGLADLHRRLNSLEIQVRNSEQQQRYTTMSNENSLHDAQGLASVSRNSGASVSNGESLEHKLSGDALPLSPKHGYFIAQILGTEQEMGSAEKLAGTAYGGSDFNDANATTSDDNDSTPFTLKTELTPDDGHYQEVRQNIMTKFGPGGMDTSQLDTLADEVVFMMQPQEVQINYRLSASRYIARRARKTLGALTYDIGLQALRCFLPDDPIRMSVILSRSDEVGWYVRLNEQMCRLSAGGMGMSSRRGEDAFTTPDAHVLSNVSFVSNNEIPGHKLQCLVDSSLGVEVLANVRLELCLVAFFEEFDRLLGRNHLFKRSIILIRTWWVYEANMSSACGISDSAFCTMILSILNRFHAKIHCPFQTLCYFLAEYSSLNFSRNVISIYGPIEVDNYMKTNFNDQSGYLITTAILNRYRKLTLAVDEDESSTMELLNETIGDNSLSDALFVQQRLKTNSDEVKTVCPFTVKQIMIAHPLLPGMMFDCPTPILRKKTGFIVESFRTGAMSLLILLGDGDDGDTNQHTLMDAFFKNSTARFGRGWRPDAPPPSWVNTVEEGSKFPSQNNNMASVSERVDRWSADSASPLVSVELSRENSLNRSENFALSDVMAISLEKTLDRIKYCNLILESQISESALKALSRLVLIEKGPLPVGEIGKMLQDACSVVSTMSTILKERFGGLKKFLERHPDDFVLANDHPFNPNVYLKDMLTVDEYAAIVRGESVSRSSVSVGSHSTINTSGTSKGRNRRNSRTSVSRKKSPAPTVPLTPEHYLMPTGNNFSRTLSSNSLEHSGGGPAPRYRSMLIGSGDTKRSPNISQSHDLDNRVRTKSTPTQQLGTGLGGLGIPDPNAPEFVPVWGMK